MKKVIKQLIKKYQFYFDKNYQYYLSKNRIDEESNNDEIIALKYFKYLRDPKIIIIIFISINIIMIGILTLIINSLNTLSFININIFSRFLIYFIFLTISVILSIVFSIKVYFSFRNYNVNEHGSERFATREEIKQQYRSIPYRNEFYEGKAGVIVAYEKGRFFIDDSPVNNIILGMTRSGKGEMFVVPLIDVYSRPIEIKNRASLVISDPKLELYKMSYKTLRERGYKVFCINIEDGEKSHGYNPLSPILKCWENKKEDDAQVLASTFSKNIFVKSEGENAIWETTSATLLTALIIAQVSDACELDKKLNDNLRYNFSIKQNNFRQLSSEKQERIIKELRYKKTIKNFNIYNEEYIPVSEKFVESRKNRDCVNLYSILQFFTNATSRKIDENNTALDIYFNKRAEGDMAKILMAGVKSAGDRTKGSIYLTFSDTILNYGLKKIAKMTVKSEFSLEDVGFGEKPVAIFLSAPDYNTSNHTIATAFIGQLYYSLASLATKGNGKCDREVIFILDEFGNMPSIKDMANLITVCLGRNIRFNLFLQDLEQLKKLYGDSARTIRGNCGNLIYILSSDNDTSEEISDMLGSKTITTVSKNGGELSMNKSITEQYSAKRLIDKNQLTRLLKGESFIRRTMKRENLKGESISPLPIANRGKYKFPYRYEYLTETFPSVDEIDETKVDFGDNSTINLDEYVLSYKDMFNLVCKDNPIDNPFFDENDWDDGNSDFYIKEGDL